MDSDVNRPLNTPTIAQFDVYQNNDGVTADNADWDQLYIDVDLIKDRGVWAETLGEARKSCDKGGG